MAINNISNPAAAANAYANMAKVATDAPVEGAKGPSFMDLIKEVATDSIQTMQAGEKMSAQAITGKANLTDVVEATTAAELTMQTVVAIRDKMLGAYQDIMRMPI